MQNNLKKTLCEMYRAAPGVFGPASGQAPRNGSSGSAREGKRLPRAFGTPNTHRLAFGTPNTRRFARSAAREEAEGTAFRVVDTC